MEKQSLAYHRGFWAGVTDSLLIVAGLVIGGFAVKFIIVQLIQGG